MSQPLYVAANLTNLHREPSFHTELLTQIYNGMAMSVLEEKEKWCRVKLTADGYEGWAYRPFLTEAAPTKATHVVCGLTSQVFADMNQSPPISVLLGGTEVCIVEQRDVWSRVQPAGNMLPAGWIRSEALRPIDVIPPADEARKLLVQYARQFTGVYYVWGGNSAFGTDCSGLMMMLCRMIRRSIPRDARQQFPVGKEVSPPFKPGDLFFFRGDPPSDRITHVGMSVGGWKMIHSSRSRNGVYEDDVQKSDYSRTFAGARSFLV